MPRELSKCREWEKDRRDRLKNEFTALSKLLPCYEPSLSLSKIDILQKASAYIDELRVQIKDLLSTKTTNKTECEEINKLHDRIKKLLTRNEQLGNLLKDAGIKLPTECGTIKKFKDTRPWSQKITPEQAKILAKREAQKDKEPKRKLLKKTTLKGKRARSAVLPSRQRKVIRKSDIKVKKKIVSKAVHAALRSNAPQTNLITLGGTQSCFIITNAPSNGLNQTVATNNATVVTNSRVFSSPLVASAVKPTPSIILTKANSSINTLTSGTLVVANGNLLPVLPQPTLLPTPTLLTHSTPVVVNATAPANNATLIVLPKNTVKETVSSVNTSVVNSTSSKSSNVTKTLPVLKPKIDLTKTTQVNKVPIPALTSRYANSFLLLSTSADATNKTNKSKASQKKSSEKSKSNKENKLRTKKENVQKVEKDASENVALKSNDLPESNTCTINAINTELKTTLEIAQNEEVAEPKLKKPKLDGLIENVAPVENKNHDVGKKVSATSAYSIDSLCNESALICASKTTEIVVKELPRQSQSVAVEITPKEKDEMSEPVVIAQNIENIVETNKVCLKSIATTTSDNKTDVKVPKIDLPETLGHSELSNDIFASLSHVTTGGQNPESTSPTAAFLLAFPLVSSLNSLKVTEVIEDETSDSQHGTPTLLQIGTMDTTKTTQSQSDNLTPNLLNLDNFSFFSSKDICSNFYPPFDIITSTVTAVSTTTTTTNVTKTMVCESVKKEYTELNAGKPKSLKSMPSQPLHIKSAITTSSYNVNVTKSFTTQASQIKNKPVVSHSQKTKQSNNAVPSTNDYTTPSVYNQTFYTHGETATTTTVALTNSDQIQGMKPKQNENRTPCTYYNTSTTYSLPQYNTFNPFTDVQSSSSYTNATRSYNDGLYSNNTNNYYNYHDNFGANATKNSKNDKFYGLNYDTYDYNRPNEIQKYDSRNQQFNNYYNQNQMQVRDKTVSNAQIVKTNPLNNSVRPPVNWMTAPDLKQQIQPDLIVPPFAKEMDFASNTIYPTNSFVSGTQTYFNTNALYSSTELHNNFGETRKIDAFPAMNTFQKNDVDENQFSWSPSKLPQLLDPPHNFVSSTLPTLVGDLALGNTQPSIFMDQKIEKGAIRGKDSRRSKPQPNYDNQTNFLSVSQLVDHNKPDVIPSRIANRRSSGNRTSKNVTKSNKRAQKPIEKEVASNYNSLKISHHDKANVKHQPNDFGNQNMENNSGWVPKNRQVNKNPPSSYSAEALISHQPQPDVMKQRNQNYTSVNKPLPFLTDNIISYFPPVEIPQENAFVQQNQNYQGGSFASFSSSIQSNVYSSGTFVPNAPTITTSYLSSTNFIPDIGNHDYNPMIAETFPHVNRIGDKHKISKQTERIDDKANMSHASVNCNMNSNVHGKKAKRKQPNEANLPGFVDFSFLSMPGTINSPILPDDFHTHSNFLPPPTPTQLYSCKNTLYAKQPDLVPNNLVPNNLVPNNLVPNNLLPIPPVTRTGIQHPEISPSLNVVGNTLTNFNLSTIFPEMNKVPGPDIYPDVTKKDFIQREFLTSSAQVSFPTKSNLPMSYINSTSTT